MPDDTSVLEAYYRAAAREIAAFEQARRAVLLAKTIETAEGKQLDKLATLFQLERRTGELDPLFRVRIRTFFRSALASGTLPEIGETVEGLLGSLDGVTFSEPDTATIEVSVQTALFDETEFSVAEFFDEVEAATAAGVRIRALERGTFRHTDQLEPVDSDHGYAELDPEAEDGEATLDDVIEGTGGTWSTIRR